MQTHFAQTRTERAQHSQWNEAICNAKRIDMTFYCFFGVKMFQLQYTFLIMCVPFPYVPGGLPSSTWSAVDSLSGASICLPIQMFNVNRM